MAPRPNDATATLQAGLEYAARGWPVHPLKPRDKRPATPHGFKDATTDSEQIATWFAAGAANVGIACGGPGPLVLDFDRHAGEGKGDGFATRAEWEARCGPLPATVVAITGGGGEQWFFADPGGIRCKNNPATGFDVKADGGYVVVPPSIHPTTGNTYQWKPGHAPADFHEPAALPATWVEALRAYTAAPQPAPRARPILPTHGAAASDGVFEVAASMDQGRLLELASGTAIVGGETIALVPGSHGKRQIWVNGRQISGFVDAEGRIAQRDTGTSAGPNGGPLASTWFRFYGHTDREIRAWLIENVPACAEAASRLHVHGLGSDADAAATAAADAAMAAAADGEPSPPQGRPPPAPVEDDPWQRPPVHADVKHHGGPRVADYFVMQFATHYDGTPMLRRWRGEWYRWTRKTGCYEPASEELVGALLYRRLTISKKSPLAEVRAALPSVAGVLIDHVELGTFIEGPQPSADPFCLAPCRNGLLDLATGELAAPTPRYFSTSTLGAPYDADAPEPTRWLGFLRGLWPNDEQSVEALQEWFGYLLTPDTRQQKILLLYGPKRSGKGTILRVLTALLGGQERIAAPTLSSLATNFGAWPLIGKLAAIIGDARIGGRSDTAQIVERLLSISGQDAQTIDRKNLTPWTGYLSARFTITSNELPRLPDASDALASRMLVLELHRQWYGQENTTLTSALLEELPGILRWAIDGWRRLRQRGRFVQPASSAAAIDELIALGSPVAAWLRERCELGADFAENRSAAYEDFKRWCDSQGQTHPPSLTRFGTDIKSAAGIRVGQRHGGQRVYLGMRLRGQPT